MWIQLPKLLDRITDLKMCATQTNMLRSLKVFLVAAVSVHCEVTFT